MEFDGFYEFMNKRYGEGWVLVGGAACWAYFTASRGINRGSAKIFDSIFPDDIDVIAAGSKPTENVAVYADGKHIEVDFVDDFDAPIRCKSAIALRNGARVLSAKDIIIKYAMTSTKRKVRQTRIEFLKHLDDGRFDATDLQRIYDQTSVKKTNMFVGGFANLKSAKQDPKE
ncbi:hypothetical protein [Sulfitobacter mediterraneus]|uniref:hypothetical protein n=1 Tax=Sulfitobacter mediterraneus TaxID=83219 RepID=UPI0021A69E2F|nr:hypothetical protein [Sulfitobacter mediterraneus]UWR10957.1 hypothetical protein K3753_17160 [Sulfitobacter mediterraneus]